MSMTATISNPVVDSYEQPTGLFINNEWVGGTEGRTISVYNPSTEELICKVAEARSSDVDLAVEAARAAFEGPWRLVTPSQRGKMLLDLADLCERNMDLLASIESMDNGKSTFWAKDDIGGVIGCIRYFGGWADKITGQTIDHHPGMLHYTRREPVGVCGQIIPWNFPLLMLAWKVAPALATGNTIVLKSAEQTPLSALVFANLVKEAGFPPGVLNIISGLGPIAGAALASHMDVDKIAFTGSTAVGRTIMKAAADSNLKKVTLELGGKSPNIVFSDADIEATVKWVNHGVFYNHGQACCAGTRIYVQATIYDKFVAAMKTRADEIKVGNPYTAGTDQGPQISKAQHDRVMGYIDIGSKSGARLVTGGARHGDQGYFIQPTIFADCTADMQIMREEIFGPVAAVAKFDTEDEVVRMANDTSYGLASGLHTQNLSRAIRVSNRLRAGTVWVNCFNMVNYQTPFGGYKQSGTGRELGEEAMANYTQTKSVGVNLDRQPPW